MLCVRIVLCGIVGYGNVTHHTSCDVIASCCLVLYANIPKVIISHRFCSASYRTVGYHASHCIVSKCIVSYCMLSLLILTFGVVFINAFTAVVALCLQTVYIFIFNGHSIHIHNNVTNNGRVLFFGLFVSPRKFRVVSDKGIFL